MLGTGESRQFLVGLQKAGAVVAAEKVLVSRHQAANHNWRCHQQAHAKDQHAQQHNQDHQGPKTQHAEKLRDELRDRDNEIIQLKLDFQTAKQRMNSSVGMQVQMMNEQKKAKEEAQKKGEELDSLRQQV